MGEIVSRLTARKGTNEYERENEMIQTGLQNKVVLITGANHGIGAATAKAFAAEGAAVLMNYLRLAPMRRYERDEEKLDIYDSMRAKSADDVVQAIRDSGGRAEAVEADLSHVATITMLTDRAEAPCGTVDILVHHADYCEHDRLLPTARRGPRDVGPAASPTLSLTAEM